jgi:hypothetical protein
LCHAQSSLPVPADSLIRDSSNVSGKKPTLLFSLSNRFILRRLQGFLPKRGLISIHFVSLGYPIPAQPIETAFIRHGGFP